MAKNKPKTVLFLCTGNYYRSRFAEVLFNSIAKRMGLPYQATSRGLALERGVNNVGPMATAALDALRAKGIRDIECCTRLPAQATPEDFAADRIVALQHAEHHPLLQERFPGFLDKVEFWHVDDAPEALPLIEDHVNELIARLLGGGGAGPPPQPPKEPPKKQLTAKVGRETAGRRGKGVTTVFDLDVNEAALLELAAKLKQRCGTGGTVKEGRIEIQGDQRDRIVKELESLGYRVKRAGG